MTTALGAPLAARASHAASRAGTLLGRGACAQHPSAAAPPSDSCDAVRSTTPAAPLPPRFRAGPLRAPPRAASARGIGEAAPRAPPL